MRKALNARVGQGSVGAHAARAWARAFLSGDSGGAGSAPRERESSCACRSGARLPMRKALVRDSCAEHSNASRFGRAGRGAGSRGGACTHTRVRQWLNNPSGAQAYCRHPRFRAMGATSHTRYVCRSISHTRKLGSKAETGEALAWDIDSDVPSTFPSHGSNSGAYRES